MKPDFCSLDLPTLYPSGNNEPHSSFIMLVQTVLKVLTALVSCAPAITLTHIVPELLQVKARESFLKHKAAVLERDMDMIKGQEEASRHVRMLTHEIRSSLDRHAILNTTLVELAKTLCMENCTIWLPNPNLKVLELTHELDRRLLQVAETDSFGLDAISSYGGPCFSLNLPSRKRKVRQAVRRCNSSSQTPFAAYVYGGRLVCCHGGGAA